MDHAPLPAFRRIDSISEVDSKQWNQLLDCSAPGYPFLRHEFLRALECSGAASADTGWLANHVLGERDGVLVAAAPVYRKLHSLGEFVFDFAWADAYHRLGMAYYPKLVACIPFTPVIGPRLLATDPAARRALAEHLCNLPQTQGLSSFHLLYAQAQDRAALPQAQVEFRQGCEFHWHNHGYANFDQFLTRLSARRRKEIRRERRRVHAAGIRVRVLTPADIDAALWSTLYRFYARTYLVRGQRPYLNPEFFRRLAECMPEAVRFFVATGPDGPLGMAFMLVGANTLYGRHWGCASDLDGLHFETCYYAGIEYCIAQGLDRFDAGTQGEHKLRRGFEPVMTYSAHAIRDPRLRAAIADFARREAALVSDLHANHRAHSAFPGKTDCAP